MNRRSALASHRCEAFDSLALRMGEIRRQLEADPGFIKELATLLDAARSPKLLVHQLGMDAHPSLAEVRRAWDKMYRRVVYRSDPMTVHAEPLAALQVGPLLQPPAAAALPVAALTGAPAPAPLHGEASVEVSTWQPPAALEVAMPAASIHVNDYESLMKRTALAYFHHLLEEAATADRRLLYACKVPVDCVRMLASKIATTSVFTAGSSLDKLLAPSKLSPYVWFSVVCRNPSSSKRPLRGELTSHDVAISVHQLISRDKQSVLVTSTPTTFIPELSGELKSQEAALILSTGMFTFAELRAVLAFEVQDRLEYVIGSQPYTEESSRMLEAMLALDAQARFESRTLACESTLAEWVEAGWVGEVRHSHGCTEWVLLDAGRAHVQPCLRLRSPSAVLRVTAGPCETPRQRRHVQVRAAYVA